MRRRTFLAGSAGLAATAVLPGFPAVAQTRPDTLNWGFHSELETLDPYASAKRTTHSVARVIQEHLLMRDPATGRILPQLATAWRWVDDTTLELTLRQGVRFHDGEAFDADDVVYTVAYVKNPANQIAFAAADYGFIREAVKVDAFTVRLVLAQPTPSAPDRLTQTLFVLPNEAHARLGAAAFASRPIGTGPYRPTVFEAGRRMEMVRNDTYYDAAWGRPEVRTIVVWSIPDVQTQVNELIAGKVDILTNVPTDQMEILARRQGITTVAGGSTSVSFLSLDAAGRSGPNPMQDKNVRLAIAHAIDRQAISSVLRGGSSEVIHAPCHPRQLGCTQDVTRYSRDLARARDFMRRSAHASGFELAIPAFTDSGPVAEAIVGDLREIGIRGRVDFRETTAWIRDFFGGRFQAAVVPWPSNGIYDASAMVPLFFMGDNGDYTRDQEIIDAFRRAGSITNAEERVALYRRGFTKIADEAYVVPLMTNVTNFAFRSNVNPRIPADGTPLIHTTTFR